MMTKEEIRKIIEEKVNELKDSNTIDILNQDMFYVYGDNEYGKFKFLLKYRNIKCNNTNCSSDATIIDNIIYVIFICKLGWNIEDIKNDLIDNLYKFNEKTNILAINSIDFKLI